MSEETKLGATGEFPNGKLNEEDEGELKLTVGIDPDSKNVIIDFGKPVAWLGMDAESALKFAEFITKRAKEAQEGT